ncbi:MAG: YeeE/YedE family protein [SAR324 cluster bacterium]|nr:YeeE/YedE family protein [SAR324 cluster bacterium]
MIRYLFLGFGILFGFVLVNAGVANYNVVREMFLFRSFHMYGLLMVAVGTSFFLTQTLKRLGTKSIIEQQPIDYSVPSYNKNHLIGGLIAGLGWALTGACPGPAIAQIGFGTLAGLFTVIGMFLGTFLYGLRQ